MIVDQSSLPLAQVHDFESPICVNCVVCLLGSSAECFRDYQEIKVQEQVHRLDVGKIPRSMWVVLEDDLVDCCKPGDDITIT